MLATDAHRLYETVLAAERLRDIHLEAFPSMIARYHSPWYNGERPERGQYDPKNHAFQYSSLLMGQLAFDNPRFVVRSKRGPTETLIGNALAHAMGRCAVDTDFQEEGEKVALDFLFCHGVLLTTLEPTPDQDPAHKDPKLRPVVQRLDPRHYGVDPFATNLRDTRLQFHVWVRDQDDLLDEAEQYPDRGWNAEFIESLAPDIGIDKLKREEQAKGTQPRHEIVGYQLWIPEWELPESAGSEAGFHGTLCDLAFGHTAGGQEALSFIRRPRPFYGPSWGPYSVVGAYQVPNKIYPLGPMTAFEGQVRELNEHARAYLEAAARRKKFGLASDKDPDIAEAVAQTGEGEIAVVNMDNLDRNFREVELGGPTEEQRLAILGLQSDLDDASGMSDAKRGNVTGIGTATENDIANAASTARLAWIKKRYRKGVNQAWKTAAWYIWHHEKVEVPLPAEFGPALGMANPATRGSGPTAKLGAKDISFEDLEIDIELLSMERTDEAQEQRRAMELLTLTAQTVPLIAQFPQAGWSGLFDMVGESINRPDLSKTLGIQAIQEAAAQGAFEQEPQSGSSQSPKMSGDKGGQRVIARPPAFAQSSVGRSVQGNQPKKASSPTKAPQKAQNQRARKAGVA